MEKNKFPKPCVEGRIPILDGLRGIAVLAVMHYHFMLNGVQHENAFWDRVYVHVVGIGWAGVDLFFVLSGFLITGILYDSRHEQHYYRVFYARRTVRIFPLYYASLAIIFPLVHLVANSSPAADGGNAHAAQVWAWVYVINWRIGLLGWGSISPMLQHFWSLSVEEQFYLFWPIMVRTFPRRRLIGTCRVMVVAALGLRFAFVKYLHGSAAAYVLTFSRMDALAIGSLVALLAREMPDWDVLVKWSKPVMSLAAAGILMIAWRAGTTENSTYWMSTVGLGLTAIFFGGCLVWAIRSEASNFARRVVSSGTLRFFGKYSYGLYICHQPVLLVLTGLGVTSVYLAPFFHNRALAILAFHLAALTISVFISILVWHLFEKHFLKLKHLAVFRYKRDDSRQSPAIDRSDRKLLFGKPIAEGESGI